MVHWEVRDRVETEEIIAHVVRGEFTKRNPKLRGVSSPLHDYLESTKHRQQELNGRLSPYRKMIRELPEEQRERIYEMLALSNEDAILTRERELMRRAIPLIEALRQQGRRLRYDRFLAYQFIERLRPKLQDLELLGLGKVPVQSEDHWPENEDEDLRELGAG